MFGNANTSSSVTKGKKNVLPQFNEKKVSALEEIKLEIETLRNCFEAQFAKLPKIVRDRFYYCDYSLIGRQFTTEPTSNPHPDRLLQGRRDFFAKPGEQVEEKPKHLVICDWTLASAANKQMAKKLINNLAPIFFFAMENKRRLFVWQTNKLIEIKYLGKLYGIEFNKITPTTKKQLYESLLSSFGITAEQSVLMDCVQTRDFLGAWNSISLVEILNSPFINDDNFVDMLADDGKWFCHTTVAELQKAQADFPRLGDLIKKRVHEITVFSSEEIVNFCNIFNDDQCSKLNDVCFNSYKVTADDVRKFIQHVPNLRTISFHACQNISGCLSELGDIQLSKLCIFSLFNSNVNVEDVRWILQHAPNMTCIYFTDCKNIAGCFNRVGSFQFTSLKNIVFGRSNVTCEDVRWIMQHVPNLERISLEGCKDIAGCFSKLGDLPLKNLKSIRLNFSKITREDLLWLLQHAPNLESIYLEGCKNIAGCFSALGDVSQLKLQSITVWENDVTADDLHWINTHVLKPELMGGPSSGTSSMAIDGNIKYSEDNMLIARRIFDSLPEHNFAHPALYRLNVFNTILNENDRVDFKQNIARPQLLDGQENILCDYDLYGDEKTKIDSKLQGYYGRYEIDASNDKLIPLPSLSAQEKLTSLYIPAKYRDYLHIYYSKDLNLYYLYNSGEQRITTTVSFVLHIPDPIVSSPDSFYSVLADKENEDIYALIKDYQAFKVADDDLSYNLTDKQKLEAIIASKTGSCRHRARAFMYQVKCLQQCKKLSPDIGVRIITNDIHEYVEIKLPTSSSWIRVDLGGYSGKLKIDDTVFRYPQESKPDVILQQQDGEMTSAPLQPQKTEQAVDLFLSPQKAKVPLASLIENKLFADQQSQNAKNILFKCNSDSVDELRFYINQSAHKAAKPRPIYFIDNPDDLICCRSCLQLQVDADHNGREKVGIIQDVGGSLFNFLKQDDGILVINWANFSHSEFVKYHSVIDAQRNIGGIKLPESMRVVSLYPKDAPDIYSGNDFIGRHQGGVVDVTEYTEELCDEFIKWQKENYAEKLNASIANDEKIADGNTITVDLYDSADWQAYLIGRWIFQGEKLIFKEGVLPQALRENKKLIIRNAPQGLDEYRRFWQKIILDKKLEYYGTTVQVPNGFKVYLQDGFVWQQYSEVISSCCPIKSTDIPQDAYILNPYQHMSFFTDIHCQDMHLTNQDGLIKQNSNKAINIYVTRGLKEGQWAELFAAAQEHNVKLNLLLAEGIKLPSSDLMKNKNGQLPNQPQGKNPYKNVIYLTNNIDNVVNKILTSEHVDKVITISDRGFSDLFYRLDAKVEEGRFSFSECESDVWKALKAGETVLLRGHISNSHNELADRMASLLTQGYLLHNGQKETFAGKLILVSDSRSALQYCSDMSLDDQEFSANCLAPRLNPQGSTSSATVSEVKIDFNKNEADVFEQERYKNVIAALESKPWVYIEGISGVGKSTYITTKFSKIWDGANETKLYEWAHARPDDKSNEYLILFIDEANLSGKDWMWLHDLEGNNPAILINGEYIKLTSRHRVVLAGNPQHYEAGRHEPELAKYAQKITFQPMPPAYLYAQILKPLKPININAEQYEEACKLWLDIYYQLNKSKSEQLTPRELETMALLFNAEYFSSSAKTIKQHAAEICWKICAPLLSNEKNINLREIITKHIKDPQTFIHLQEEVVPNQDMQAKLKQNGFFYTSSRLSAYAALCNFLQIRNLKIENPDTQLASTPGLGGMLLSGLPGVGKSIFIHAVLQAKNYVECDITQALPDDNKNKYIYLPSTMDFSAKEKLLAEAYQKGIIVIIDELNTPYTEHLLNKLVGTRTNIVDKPKPGFMILGTQNPASMVGRTITSSAIQHRLLNIDLPEYTKAELINIEKDKYSALAKTEQFENSIDDFLHKQTVADNMHYEHPSLRELEICLDAKNQEIIGAKKTVLYSSNPYGLFAIKSEEQACKNAQLVVELPRVL